MTNFLPCIEIEPEKIAQHTIIWMHGLGADGNDFVPIIEPLSLPSTLPIRFVFPHAPVMPITVQQGYQMRAWYDIRSFSMGEEWVDQQGIAQSVVAINQLIAKEIQRGIPPANIILAGFSQGAVMTLTTGLQYPQSLGGLIALSGYLPLAHEVVQRAHPANINTPIFMAHGTEDNIVPFALGKLSCAVLKKAGCSVSWHAYQMAHSVCPEEIAEVSHWIQERLLFSRSNVWEKL